MADQKTPWVRDLGREQPGGPILIVHGGMSDESPWLRVGEVLAERFHVALIRRRLYRLDVSVAVGTAMADQVAEVLAVAAGLGTQCVIVGHSSGAIVALEALVADPGLFAGAVLYEPPSPLPALPLGEPTTVDRCRKALSERRVGRALQIFLCEGVRVPGAASALAPALALLPAVRGYVARQIDDLDAQLVRLPGTGHGANQSHQRQLGELIADLVDLVDRC